MTEEHTQEDGQQRETHRVSGDDLLGKVKELIREGSVRRIAIKNEDGKTLLEIPMVFGLAGAALWPVFAAVGAVAALVTNCSIEVERKDQGGEEDSES